LDHDTNCEIRSALVTQFGLNLDTLSYLGRDKLDLLTETRRKKKALDDANMEKALELIRVMDENPRDDAKILEILKKNEGENNADQEEEPPA